MTHAEIGGLMLVAFGVFYWLSIFAWLRAVLAFLGTVLAGSDGHLTRWLAVAVTWVAHEATSVTGWALGVGLPFALAIVAGVVFLHDLHPKKSAGKRTGWAGIVLGLLIVAGATGIGALSNVQSAVNNGVTSVQNSG